MGGCEGVGGRKWRVITFPHSLSLVPRPSHPRVGHLQYCKWGEKAWELGYSSLTSSQVSRFPLLRVLITSGVSPVVITSNN